MSARRAARARRDCSQPLGPCGASRSSKLSDSRPWRLDSVHSRRIGCSALRSPAPRRPSRARAPPQPSWLRAGVAAERIHDPGSNKVGVRDWLTSEPMTLNRTFGNLGSRAWSAFSIFHNRWPGALRNFAALCEMGCDHPAIQRSKAPLGNHPASRPSAKNPRAAAVGDPTPSYQTVITTHGSYP
jgi:hypothetical protein